jgi:hypothetical protein
MDSSGKVLQSIPNTDKISITSYPKGIYYLVIKNDKGFKNFKVEKNNSTPTEEILRFLFIFEKISTNENQYIHYGISGIIPCLVLITSYEKFIELS